MVVLEIFDPRDHDPPAAGPVLLRDAETGELGVAGGKAWADGLRRQRLERRMATLRSRSAQVGIDHLEIRTDRPYLPALIDFFERRRRKLGR